MSDAAIAIPNLLHRYAEAIDAGDFAAAAALFRHGSIVAQGQRIEGEDQLAALWRGWVRLYEDGTPRTRHLISNPIIELDDEAGTAVCRSQWTVLQATPDLPLQVIATGRYNDRFARLEAESAGGEWAFVERHYAQIDLMGDMTAHLQRSVNGEDA